jgi:hypothetical protein
MLIFYPRLSNGNVLWTCDNCGDTAEVSSENTNAVALVCMCDTKVHPQCNSKWYYDGLYHSRRIYKERFEG